ncbi:MAG TPA: alpha/beta fold hydrolase [Fibrobacteria bacterium]|nr:alpha/beta fold hydrolase [Fibrobacteria bacterium]
MIVASPTSPFLPGLKLDHSRGTGPFHFLLVPGLVPDGPETFLRQKAMFLSKGDVSTANWPDEFFSLDEAIQGIAAFVDHAILARRKPVLVGVSVGGGIVLEYLRRMREEGASPDLAGLILVSPLVCTGDISPLLKRLWDPIVSDSGDPVRALEKGRSFFRQLASKSAGQKPATQGWKRIFATLTPAGIAELADAPIRERIERTLERIPPHGAIQRCKALGLLPGLETGQKAKDGLTKAPTLLLWGSKERHTLDMDGPGTGTLCRPDLAERHFPSAEIHWIYTKKGEPVPHASLLKHHKAFARPLKRFLKRI